MLVNFKIPIYSWLALLNLAVTGLFNVAGLIIRRTI